MINSSSENVVSALNELVDRGNNEFTNAIIQSLPMAIYTCDREGYIRSYNKAAVKLWGKEPKIGKDKWYEQWRIFTPSGQPLRVEASPMARVLKETKTIEGEEIIVQRADGTSRIVLPFPTPLFDHFGVCTGAVNTLIDITEQKQSEKNNALFAAIIESSHDAIVSKNLNSIIQTWNKEAENMFGWKAEEAIGKHITLIIPKERWNEEDVIVNKIRNGEKIDHFETIRVRKDGTLLHLSLTISPVRDSHGKIIGASKIARDITRQKQLEEKMLQTTKHLQIINSVAKATSENLDTREILQKVTDATTLLVGAEFGAFFYNVVNSKGETYRLYTLSGAPREAFEKFGMPRNTQIFKTTFNGEGILRSDDITKDKRYGHNYPHNGMPKGHLPVVSYLAVPVFSKSGNVIGGLFYGHSQAARFTEEHEALIAGVAAQAGLALDNAKLFEEVEALNAKKDEFIGLASHELKTPVTSVLGYLQILDRNLADDDRNKNLLNKAVQQVNKLTTLISDLLDISKIHTGKLPFSFTSFDLIALIEDIRDMMQQSNTTHKIHFNTDIKELFVFADRQRIEQVIVNLISNAIKYSPAADLIVLKCTTHDNKAAVSVQDFGVGINADEQQKIFERFYRVKTSTSHISGLGIGLYISNEIINRHKGKFFVNSEVGAGSTFTFEIPINRESL